MGFENCPLGDAILELIADELHVFNVGASGEDGFRINDVGFAPNFGIAGLIPDAQVGAFFEHTLIGFVDGEPDRPMGSNRLEVVVNDDGREVVRLTPTNLQDVGAETYELQVLLHGQIVFSESGRTGPALDFSSGVFASQMDCWCISLDGCHYPCLTIAPAQVVGGPMVEGDDFVLTPEGTADTGPITSVEFRGANLGRAIVTLERVDLCPWDCGDGDGEVGVADLLALLSQWGTVNAPCDFDGDGVAVSDILNLLTNWGPCPPEAG